MRNEHDEMKKESYFTEEITRKSNEGGFSSEMCQLLSVIQPHLNRW